MRAPTKTQIDPVMNQALTLHPFAGTDFRKQIDRALFEQPGAHSLLAIFAGVFFDHHGLDALQMQQL